MCNAGSCYMRGSQTLQSNSVVMCLHVEGNILCSDYARARPLPPFLCRFAAHAQSQTPSSIDTISVPCQHNNSMTQMRCALLNWIEKGNAEQPQKRLLFQGMFTALLPQEEPGGACLHTECSQETFFSPSKGFFLETADI